MNRKKIYYFLILLFVIGVITASLPLLAGADNPSTPAAAAAPTSDPSGSLTGTVKDITAKEAGKPVLQEIAEAVGHNKISINIIWTLITGYLVMFMQLGFALVETGFTRAKNAAHTMVHEYRDLLHRYAGLLDLRLCLYVRRGGPGREPGHGGQPQQRSDLAICSAKTSASSGIKVSFLTGDTYDVAVFTLFLFQMVFMDTTATIPTGALAERWKFLAFVVYGFVHFHADLSHLRQLGLGRRLALPAGH